MVKNFLGLEGIKISTLGKNGKFKPARTISWLKAGPRTFFVFIVYGVEKILTDVTITFWDIPLMTALLFCVWAGFIYPHINPLKVEEMNDVEKNDHTLYR